MANAQRADVLIAAQFKEWGFPDTFATWVKAQVKQGYDTAEIYRRAQDTDAWKKRFRGNELRMQKGLRPLEPAQYMALEASYRQVMQAAGTPKGFWDQQSDFEDLIGRDVSPEEVGRRVTMAREVLTELEPGVRAEFERFYSPGEMTSYFLDPKRTVSILERRKQAAAVAAAGARMGFNDLGKATAERVAELGLNDQQVIELAGRAGRAMDSFRRLGQVNPADPYTRDDAWNATFYNDKAAQEKERRLLSAERGQFQGRSGLTARSLTKRTAGNL